jgi:hypothetical protein
MVPVVLENMSANRQETTASMVVLAPKPRVVKLVISKTGQDRCSVVGNPHEATHYQIKIDLGGLAGVVAPLIGKAPPDIQLWVIGGQAPTFAREEGPLYSEGPTMTIQLASPTWTSPEAAGH